MKNIHVLPTDKPSNLVFEKISNRFYTNSRRKENSKNIQNQNIYITSDEEIKEGDWHLSFLRDKFEVINYLPNGGYRAECLGKEVCKIILTTDPSLAPDVQAIDDDFLEWFVKNPNCEEVGVEDVYKTFLKGDKRSVSNFRNKYKIIIPKEEPKQETLEEAFQKYSEYLEDFENKNTYEHGFKDGAKWQQKRSYSEEEVLEIIRQYALEEHLITSSKPDIWFEQFKNK